MFGMGTWEIALVLVIALLVLGPDKLPSVARSIGKGLREMRRATNDLRVHMELDDIPDEPRVQTAPAKKHEDKRAEAKNAAKALKDISTLSSSEDSSKSHQEDAVDD